MNDIDYRVLGILLHSPRALIRDAEEANSLCAMALYIERPVSDVYEMPDGAFTGKITETGRRLLAKHKIRQGR
jgi:hypothetical protein